MFYFLFLSFVEVVNQRARRTDRSGQMFTPKAIQRKRVKMLEKLRPRRIKRETPIREIVDNRFQIRLNLPDDFRVIEILRKKAFFRSEPVNL